MANKRVARLVVRDVRDPDAKKTIEIGSLFESDKVKGSYSVSLATWDKDTKTRNKIVALKPEGESPIRLDEKGIFVNLDVYEPLEEKEPYNG